MKNIVVFKKENKQTKEPPLGMNDDAVVNEEWYCLNLYNAYYRCTKKKSKNDKKKIIIIIACHRTKFPLPSLVCVVGCSGSRRVPTL